VSNPTFSSTCEEKTYEYLFHLHGKVIRNFLYYKCGSIQLAEDWLQEAFLKLWQECDKVPPEKARSFLFTVANNLFLDYVRHEKIVLNFAQQSHSKNQNTDNPEVLLEASDLQKKLLRAIAALPEHQRVVFSMNRFDGITYSEIAEILDVSVKTVEKRMHNALVVLRKVLNSI
jgi:RNA polymerase sigma-70 factor (ECF subfamily)